MSSCRQCHRLITFVENTETGRRIPVDPAPDEDGNLAARRPPEGQMRTRTAAPLIGRPLTKGEALPAGHQRYMPHHATCLARKPKRGRARPRPEPQLFEYETTQPERHTR